MRSPRLRPPERLHEVDPPDPLLTFWIEAGLLPQAARALANAGLSALVDLEGRSRAELRAIPGIGRASLAVLAELLGWPLPTGATLTREELWRRRGLPFQAAVTFAQVAMTLNRLGSISREELLDMPHIGPKALRACELLLGRPLPSRRPADPAAAFWRSQGLDPRTAKTLSRAGITSIQQLRSATREDLLTRRGIGPILLRQLEKLLGTEIPSRVACWLGRGFPLYLANALVRVNIHSIADLAALTRKQFLALPGLGLYALAQCEKKLGLRLPNCL